MEGAQSMLSCLNFLFPGLLNFCETYPEKSIFPGQFLEFGPLSPGNGHNPGFPGDSWEETLLQSQKAFKSDGGGGCQNVTKNDVKKELPIEKPKVMTFMNTSFFKRDVNF